MTERDTERRRGAYVPPADEDDTFDARDDSRRGPLLLTAAAAVFVLFVGVVWSAYRQGIREGGREAAPRILADAEPYRERPADPGGEETPDLDISAYDLLEGEGDDTGDATPRPGPEEPMDGATRPGLQVETMSPDEVDDPIDDSAGAEVDDTPVRLDPPVDDTPIRTPEVQSRPETTTPDTSTPTPQPVETDDPPPVRTASIAAVEGGDWVVQIGSFRSEGEAEEAWVNFISRHSGVASGVSPDIQSAEIEGRGTYHRLRIAAFGSRDDASAYCSSLQDRGQDCFVARR
ncbi:SPOR domain-containing protein [Hyphobacterium marinum]|uniref:SPOR domain-containing protein n=1 Tax=Hyphobacterium marinum TaxID=3116574 RepID=A0ABU7M1C1_9PROT|nr:SPOR domain-containing protein [Hyphobacterium sp. Y6023]MEE2567619.1 SPOR domain-containing protein [Hyphobacterium sp. Y6023]